MDRPLMVGPQYPFVYMSTTFEPDRAFNLSAGQSFWQFGQIRLNTQTFSPSAYRNDDFNETASGFHDLSDQGYSVYFDGEIDRQIARYYKGLTDGVEFQLTYRKLRVIKGTLDRQIESFHKSLGLDNQNRDKLERDQMGIYIMDNETDTIVYQVSQPSDKFHQESMTLGFKFRIRETQNEAIALVVSSNFGDNYIEKQMNESTADGKEFRNFNDRNFALIYSSLWPDWSLHSGFSFADTKSSLFKNSPKEIYYFFLGFNFHLGQHSDWLLQGLDYSSPYPENAISNINDDIREVSTGLRWHWSWGGYEMGLIENTSQGQQNIDIALFSNFMFSF